ncbi:MAG: YceI family protein [Coxiellaceae bacterium]|nr:YceI family protein [Coxiellaceae bacterium]
MKKTLACLLLSLPLLAYSAVPSWVIDHSKSHLTFTATQMGAPTKGEFKKFSGTIQFDRDKLDESHIIISVDMTSVYTSYEDLQQELMNPAWFDTVQFPKAVFTSTMIKLIKDNQYLMQGDLALRDKTLPVSIEFTIDQYSKTNAIARGKTTLHRTAFGIGQGEYQATDDIADNVLVEFVIVGHQD